MKYDSAQVRGREATRFMVEVALEMLDSKLVDKCRVGRFLGLDLLAWQSYRQVSVKDDAKFLDVSLEVSCH